MGNEKRTLAGIVDKINYKDWLFDSRRLEYHIITRGVEANEHELQVRWLRYGNKIIAMESNAFMGNMVMSLMIEENKIIRGYEIEIDLELYSDFIKKILVNGAKYLGTNNDDENKKAIIEFYNDLIDKGTIIPVSEAYYNMFNFNPWWFPRYTENINNKKVKYKKDDIIKFTDTVENTATYGLLRYYSENTYKDEIGFYKCDVLDEDNEKNNLCVKYFLLFDINYGTRYKVEKVDENELSDIQKGILKRFRGDGNEQ